jgi:hypothetical protein
MIAITAALLLAQSIIASSPSQTPMVNPRAAEAFERDGVLKAWGLRFYDHDKDARLSVLEAAVAAKAFKNIADGDGDGRVTTYEYDRAREFVIARWSSFER